MYPVSKISIKKLQPNHHIVQAIKKEYKSTPSIKFGKLKNNSSSLPPPAPPYSTNPT